MTAHVLTAGLSLGIVIVMLLRFPQTFHWFLLPTLLCGLIIGLDAVQWVMGDMDLFDPIGIGGVLGYFSLFIAPMCVVILDNWWPSYFVNAPADWRPWLGLISTLNVFGLVLYRFSRGRVFAKLRASQPVDRGWRISERQIVPVFCVALAATAALQIYVYARLGGVSGYMSAFENQALGGMGLLFMVSESFPILLFMAYAIVAAKRPSLRNWGVIIGALFVFFILKMLFGGLRGSRSNTIWGLFWAAGIVHLWLRPLGRKFASTGLAFLVAFMFVYGFYKSYGAGVVDAYRGSNSVSGLQEESGRSWESLALGDLSRSYVQAFVAYRLSGDIDDLGFEYRKGSTYVFALMLPVPNLVPLPRPDDKRSSGAVLMYGTSAVDHERRSSWIYGLLGEGMINFGVWVAPLTFVIWGCCVGATRRWLCDWSERDARKLMLPFAINVAVVFVSLDLDNVVFMLFKEGLIPCVVIFCGTERRKQRYIPAATRTSIAGIGSNGGRAAQ